MRVATALVAFALVVSAHASTARVSTHAREGGGKVYVVTLGGNTATIETDGEGGVYARTPTSEVYEMGEDEKSTLDIVMEYVIKELKQLTKG